MSRLGSLWCLICFKSRSKPSLLSLLSLFFKSLLNQRHHFWNKFFKGFAHFRYFGLVESLDQFDDLTGVNFALWKLLFLDICSETIGQNLKMRGFFLDIWIIQHLFEYLLGLTCSFGNWGCTYLVGLGKKTSIVILTIFFCLVLFWSLLLDITFHIVIMVKLGIIVDAFWMFFSCTGFLADFLWIVIYLFLLIGSWFVITCEYFTPFEGACLVRVRKLMIWKDQRLIIFWVVWEFMWFLMILFWWILYLFDYLVLMVIFNDNLLTFLWFRSPFLNESILILFQWRLL